MRIICITIVLIALSLIFLGQQKIDSSKNNAINPKPVTTEINLTLPEILKIQDLTEKNHSSSFIEKNMPWAVALLIGVLSAFINLLISHRLKQSNEKNLLKQIENNKEINLTQFKSTIATKNRQDWINEVRHSLCEILENGNLLCFEILGSEPNTATIKAHFGKFLYSKSKIKMLLNEKKSEQRKVLEELINFSNTIKDIFKTKKNSPKQNDAEDQLIQAARELFEIHWKKIKQLA
jgi:hypothetical protein